MKNQFRDLYQKMCQPITFAELQGVYRELKTIGDFNDELLTAMQEELDASRWGCLCKLIWAIPDPAPGMFSPFLCRLLDDHRHLEIMEAVADAMSSITDEEAVPSLIGVLDHYLIGDADFHFNRKILYALANIGSPEAIAGITSALQSPEEIIRTTAKKELDRIRATKG
jgi:hypothetical protein